MIAVLRSSHALLMLLADVGLTQSQLSHRRLHESQPSYSRKSEWCLSLAYFGLSNVYILVCIMSIKLYCSVGVCT